MQTATTAATSTRKHARSTARRPPRYPHCRICQRHIGWGADICGACSTPTPLSMRELMRLARLVRLHWGDGRVRTLLRGDGGYRPTLITVPIIRRFVELDRSLYQERAELADLYDRAQASRGDERRAVRT